MKWLGKWNISQYHENINYTVGARGGGGNSLIFSYIAFDVLFKPDTFVL